MKPSSHSKSLSLETVHFSIPPLRLEKPCRLFLPLYHPLSTTVSAAACLLHCATTVIVPRGSHCSSKCWVKGILSCCVEVVFGYFLNVQEICQCGLPLKPKGHYQNPDHHKCIHRPVRVKEWQFLEQEHDIFSILNINFL